MSNSLNLPFFISTARLPEALPLDPVIESVSLYRDWLRSAQCLQRSGLYTPYLPRRIDAFSAPYLPHPSDSFVGSCDVKLLDAEGLMDYPSTTLSRMRRSYRRSSGRRIKDL